MTRTPYWLINGGFIIDWLAIPIAAVFCYGLFRHWKNLKQGTFRCQITISQLRNLLHNVQWDSFIYNGILDGRIFQKPLTGLCHSMIFVGMLLLFAGTLFVLLYLLLGLPVFKGHFNQWVMDFTLDTAGLIVILAVIFLLVRRLSGYKRLVTPKARKGFIPAELLLLGVLCTGFFVEALRIYLTDAQGHAYIGNILAAYMNKFPAVRTLYIGFWWFHGLLALGFIAYIPFSPLVHLIFIPVNAGLKEPLIGAEKTVIDEIVLQVESEDQLPVLGTPRLIDFSAKRLLDISTCLWCGRCQEVCPTVLTSKSLNPKGVMAILSHQLKNKKFEDDDLINSIGMETLFECRTCGACVQNCPAMVNPLKAIIGMRQNLIMERGEIPTSIRQTYRNLETLMHPFSSSAAVSEWRNGLSVPHFIHGQTEYLLWIGCAVTYEDRAREIGRAMVKILNKSGISYGIIEEARCTGDPAKQLGDDYLFSMLAGANIELFDRYEINKIITMCPHCYNSFRNYYPPLGGKYKIISHVELIKELIDSGRIKIEHTSTSSAYHDPCYLGRHNDIFESPRIVLEKIGSFSELPRHGGNSFCCGAGGGNYWNEENGQRINYLRAEEAFNEGTDKIACACPFCLLMLTDGFKMYTDKQMVFDIAELVAENMDDSTNL